jgi:transposase InsO family protein
MVTHMNDIRIRTVDDVQRFLDGAIEMEFSIEETADRYRWMQGTLVRLRYTVLGKKARGVVLRYLERLSGYSRAQVKRLVKQYVAQGRIVRQPLAGKRFAGKYTAADVRLLAQTDTLHGQLCGATTKKICARMCAVHGDTRYERLAKISVSHLYNLRRSQGYQRQRRHFDTTTATRVRIGERRKPAPEGRPGYLRVDTVHQGDLDGIKGVYHINAVDEVTQYQCVFSVEAISERFLKPVLNLLMVSFPFVIRGFHADNGSEYINHRVARLLKKLHIELTKSRPRRSTDNALAECKNGVVLRKHLGYEHIPGRWAAELNAFHRLHFNPYLNFHRPCFFATRITDNKGKQVKRYDYKQMMTPYEKLRSLPNAESYLRAGESFAALDTIERSMTDNVAVEQLNRARTELFRKIFSENNAAA